MDGDRTAPLTTDGLWEQFLSVRDGLAALAHADLDVFSEEDARGVAVVLEEGADADGGAAVGGAADPRPRDAR